MGRTISPGFIEDGELSEAKKRTSRTAQPCNIEEKLRISKGHKHHATNASDEIVLEKDKKINRMPSESSLHPPSLVHFSNGSSD